MKLNRYDLSYIVILIVIAVALFVSSFFIFSQGVGEIAVITYNKEQIMEVDLLKNQEITLLKSDYPLLLADMVIEVKDGKIRVKEELSPYHYCSQVGFISNPQQSIICIPNKIMITIQGTLSGGVDLEVR